MILNVGIGVEGDRSDVVNAFLCLAVQGFDIAERMGEAESRDAHLVGREPVEHERVVGVGTVRDGDFARGELRVCGDLTRGTRNAHARTLGARLIRTATAAASRTFITSANTNQYSPKKTAFLKEPVATASQLMPIAKSNNSATIPAAAARAKVLCPRSNKNPARLATNGYAIRYLPVKPNNCNVPPGPAELNTGNPAAPSARYKTIAANARRGPSRSPTTRTPKF